jgi:hypothetical protein
MRRLSLMTFSCALALAACDDDPSKPAADTSGDTSGDTTGDTTADSAGDTTPSDTSAPGLVDDRFAAAYCDIVRSCYANYDTTENIVGMLLRDASPEECKAWIRRVLFDDSARDAGLVSGAYTLDEARLQTCLSTIADTCGQDPMGACQEVLEGKLALGSPCEHSDDCAGDAFCDDPDGCGGVCRARVGSGEACDSTEACSNAGAALACSWESSSCVPLVRVANAPLGADCGDVTSATEVTFTSCAAPNVCEGGKCQAIVPAGAVCTGDRTPCAKGYVCWPDGVGAETGTCKAVTFADTAGAACNQEFGSPTAVYCNPVLFLGCKEGKCERIGDGSAGSTCFTNQDPDVPCGDGLYCDSAAYQCSALKPEGAPCDDYDECASGYCDTSPEQPVCAASSLCQ